MKTILDVAQSLQAAAREQRTTAQALHKRTGLNYGTVQDCIKGEKDSRLSTVLALAASLDYELVLVPKQVAATLQPFDAHQVIPTLVERTLASTSKNTL